MKAHSANRQATLGYGKLLRFFLPIGITFPIISSTHLFINAALARMAAPELNIALFTLMKGLTNSIKAPTMTMRQLTVALVEGRSSYRTIRRFLVWAATGFVAVLAVLAYTPLFKHILPVLYDIHDLHRISLAGSALRIMCFLPLVEILRNSMHALLIRNERSGFIPLGTTMRLALLVVFLWWVVVRGSMDGVIAASIGWVAGIGVEAVMMIVYVVIRFGSPARAAAGVEPRRPDKLTMRAVLIFFAPLAAMIILKALVQPIVQSGITRAEEATRYVAAYGLAQQLTLIANGPVRALHQCALSFVRNSEDPNWPIVRSFCVLVGTALSILMVLACVTPLARLFFLEVISAPASLAPKAVEVLLAFSPFPIIWAWREAYWGLLMLQRTTNTIAGAKVVNLCVVVVGSVVGLGPLLGAIQAAGINPGVVAAIVIMAGELAETLLVRRITLRMIGRRSVEDCPKKGNTQSGASHDQV